MDNKKSTSPEKKNIPRKDIGRNGEIVCPYCGGNAFIITRVTGYFSKTNQWNMGKLAELRERDLKSNIQYFNNENE